MNDEREEQETEDVARKQTVRTIGHTRKDKHD